MPDLDESQRSAFDHCLINKLAIVQGPPGTGKTFIGVKLVEALLAAAETKEMFGHIDYWVKRCLDESVLRRKTRRNTLAFQGNF